MPMKQMYSQNVIAKLIQQGGGSKYSGSDIYKQLREMVESGVLENEGVGVTWQETNMGSYGKVYSFDSCEKTLEIWMQLYGHEEASASALLIEIRDAVDGNKQLRSFFPNWLYRKLLKFIADNSK